MSVKDFIKSVDATLELNHKVANALADIMLSDNATTSINYTPIQKTQYEHSTSKESLYNSKTPTASRMFNSTGAMRNFDLGYANELLQLDGDENFKKRFATLSSINDSTNLTLNTIASALSKNARLYARAKNSDKTQVWRKFKIGEYWPVTVNKNFSAELQCTSKIDLSADICKSKYAFIKLSPDKDAKSHIISIDVDAYIGLSVPVVFIALDSYSAIDGDSFDFKIEYVSSGNITDYTILPEIIFFDSKYNSSAIPSPSISRTVKNESVLGGSVRISGVDYYYINAKNLPSSTRIKYSLGNADNVFVSAEDLNNTIFPHSGVIKYLDFNNLTGLKYTGFGAIGASIISNNYNDFFNITTESIGSNKTKANNYKAIKSNGTSVVFSNRPGNSMFFGRPSSFFKPKISTDYTNCVNYGDPVEWISGNTLSQYKYNDLLGPLTTINNGIVFEFNVDISGVGGNGAVIRFGHFESILGANIVVSDNGIKVNVDGAIPVEYSIDRVNNLKCSIGFIRHKSILYTRVLISDSTVLVDTGLVSAGNVLEARLINRLLPAEIASKPDFDVFAGSLDIFRFWSPVLSVLIEDVTNTSSSIKVGSIKSNSELAIHEFNNVFDVNSTFELNETGDLGNYIAYSSSRGEFDPLIIRPSDINGFICKVAPSDTKTYSTSNTTTSLASFRVGVTYNAYKGKVYSGEYNGQITIPPTKVTTITNTQPTVLVSSLDALQITTSDNAIDSVDTTLESKLIISPKVGDLRKTAFKVDEESIDETVQVDSIYGTFGWKISEYRTNLVN